MQEIKNKTPIKKIEYEHFIEYKGEQYIREETLSLKAYCWESDSKKLIDFHIIKWRMLDENHYQIFGNLEYYSSDKGWSKDKILNKKNPIPNIEKEFKKTIGKDLVYF